MTNGTSAFFKGGFGCLLAFVAIGLTAVLLGGRMHIDALGAVMLFAIGGILGLVVFAIYRKGYAAGRQTPPPVDDEGRLGP